MDFKHIINLYTIQSHYGLSYLENDIAIILNDYQSFDNYISSYLNENPHLANMLYHDVDKKYQNERIINIWNRIDHKKQKYIYDTLLQYHFFI